MADTATRVGLVLGAGGVAGGAFHSGVLAALEEVTGWDPRRAAIIVGTSAGSVTATTLRAGLSAQDLRARAEERPLSAEGVALMRSVGPPVAPPSGQRPQRARRPGALAATLARAASRPFAAAPWALAAGLVPEGSVGTDLVQAGVHALCPNGWPAEPLWICAVRQSDGKRMVFGRGDGRPPLPLAVAASCAIPGFFTPVDISGETYIDGGVHSPTNADLAGDAGLDLVIVSSPMSLAGKGLRVAADQPLRRMSSALLATEVLRLRRRGGRVVAFQPTVHDIEAMGTNAMDPSRRSGVAQQAHRSTLERLARADTRDRLRLLG